MIGVPYGLLVSLIPAGDTFNSRGQRPRSVNLSALLTLQVASALEITALSLGERVPDEGGRVRGLFSPLTLLASLPLRVAEFSQGAGRGRAGRSNASPGGTRPPPSPHGRGLVSFVRVASRRSQNDNSYDFSVPAKIPPIASVVIAPRYVSGCWSMGVSSSLS